MLVRHRFRSRAQGPVVRRDRPTEAPVPIGWGRSLRHRPPAGMRVDEIREPEGIAPIVAQWEALAAPSGNPALHPAWALAGASAFRNSGDLRVLAAGLPFRLRAVAPLVKRRSWVLSRLELVTAKEMYEPMDLPFADAEALRALTDAIARSKSGLFLRRLPADSAAVEALRRSFSGRGVIVVRRVRGYPWVRLDPGWARPEGKLSARRRSDLRRAWRRA